MIRTGFMERYGKLEEMDRSFDLAFWQAQPPETSSQAAWKRVIHACKVKDIDVHQLRLQRSVENFQRPQR